MTWESFYLVCFIVGLLLSALSLLGGMGRFGTHFHMHHAAHLRHVSHIPHAPHVGHTAGATRGFPHGAAAVPWWNTFSLMVFLCWFGGAGYLLARHSALLALVVLVLAILCGVVGGAIVFAFWAKVMLPHEHELSADETPIVGVVGRVTSAISARGTGEIVYEQLGARRSAPARSEDGSAIARAEEVFVLRYERGIAYVRRWEEVELGSRSPLE